MIDWTKDTLICAFCGKPVKNDVDELGSWTVKGGEEFPIHVDCLVDAWADGLPDEEVIKFKDDTTI